MSRAEIARGGGEARGMILRRWSHGRVEAGNMALDLWTFP